MEERINRQAAKSLTIGLFSRTCLEFRIIRQTAEAAKGRFLGGAHVRHQSRNLAEIHENPIFNPLALSAFWRLIL